MTKRPFIEYARKMGFEPFYSGVNKTFYLRPGDKIAIGKKLLFTHGFDVEYVA